MAERSMVPLAGSERTKRLGATLIALVLDDELIEFAAVLRARLGGAQPGGAGAGRRGELTTAAAPDPDHVAAVKEYAPPCPPASSPTIDHLRFWS